MKTARGFWQKFRSALTAPFRFLFARFLERHDRIHEKRIRREIEVTLTHELKTPLTTILGYSEILMENTKELDGETALYARNIYRQSRELVRFIDNLIVLSVMDFNPQVFFVNEVEIGQAIRESIQEFEKEHRGENTGTIRYEGSSPVVVRCNERLLRKSLMELFLNAWLYRKPDKDLSIVLRTGADGRDGFVSIEDNGVGIPSRYLVRIWEKFFRVEAEDNSRVPGLGVGLCLVRQSVELFGGKVSVDSREGKGTRFEIRLPLADPTAAR